MKAIESVVATVICGVLSGTWLSAGDLSKYREFQLGSDLATVAQQAHTDRSLAKVVQERPALLEDLTWRPQPFTTLSSTEPVREALFSFYNGELYQIAVSYDPYRTEGMSVADLVEAISKSYGTAVLPTVAVKTPQAYGDTEESLAVWEDTDYSFKLVRRSYGPTFALIGVQKKLEALAQASILIATRLDAEEAPQKEAARVQSEAQTERAKKEDARLKNKPNFRP